MATEPALPAAGTPHQSPPQKRRQRPPRAPSVKSPVESPGIIPAMTPGQSGSDFLPYPGVLFFCVHAANERIKRNNSTRAVTCTCTAACFDQAEPHAPRAYAKNIKIRTLCTPPMKPHQQRLQRRTHVLNALNVKIQTACTPHAKPNAPGRRRGTYVRNVKTPEREMLDAQKCCERSEKLGSGGPSPAFPLLPPPPNIQTQLWRNSPCAKQ